MIQKQCMVGMHLELKEKIKTGYVRNCNQYSEDEIWIRPSDNLKPSKELYGQYTCGDISWHVFKSKYMDELSHRVDVYEELQDILHTAENNGNTLRILGYRKDRSYRHVIHELLTEDKLYLLRCSLSSLISKLNDRELFKLKSTIYYNIYQDYLVKHEVMKRGWSISSHCMLDICSLFERIEGREYGHVPYARCLRRRGVGKITKGMCPYFKLDMTGLRSVLYRVGGKCALIDLISQIKNKKTFK